MDKVAPSDLFGHFREDVIPSVFCCHGEFSDCSLYYSKRPSDDGERFNPPNPGKLISLAIIHKLLGASMHNQHTRYNAQIVFDNERN